MTAGADIASARAAVLLIHGRDQSPAFMLQLVERLSIDDVAYWAPAAADSTWYPQRYHLPVADNEPRLSQALAAYTQRLDQLAGPWL